jgi:rSAM/selenodomain-associated transferase 1
MENFLGLLAKYPEAGKVKTRLARDIGAEGAARIYKIVAERVFRDTSPDRDSDFDRIIFYSPPEDKGRFESWIPGGRLLPQRGRDMGDIMRNALRDLLESGASKAVITGADILDLNRTVIGDAFLRLKSADVVIGPAEDGGYYLIGMKDLHEQVFEGIAWSTDKVFADTVCIIERLGLSYSTVTTLSDVDRIEDIIRHDNLLEVLCKEIGDRIL